MFLVAEFGLFVFGLFGLFAGKLPLSKTRVVHGTPARLLSLLAITPLPLSLMLGMVLGLVLIAQGRDLTVDPIPGGIAALLDLAIIGFCLVLFFGIGMAVAKRQEAEDYEEE